MSPRAASGVRVRSAVLLKLGHAIRSLRVERRYCQERFARHVGLDRSYFGAIERGEHNITYETLAKIADGLDSRPSEILRRSDL
jgi:transcriptional regulator with XRE-family HTH domain